MKKKNTVFFKMILLMMITICWWKSVVISNASEKIGTVTLSIEKFTIGQGYLIEPTQVVLHEGDTCANLVKDILKKNNYEIEASTTSNGWYLSGIKNADNGTTKIPDVIKNMDTQVNGKDIIYPPDDTAKNVAYPDLSEFSYHRNAGWMYSVNGEFPNVGMAARIPKDGDVIRVQFTVYGLGADLGSQYKDGGVRALNIANKEKLTKKVAQFNEQKGKWLNIYSASDRYNYAMEVLEKLDSKQWKVDDALEQLEQIMNKNNLTIAQIEEINKVKQKINAIGTVDLSKESQIAEARKSYNALTSEQKELISADTLKVLTDAEKNIVSLKAEKKTQDEAKKKAEAAKKKYTPSKTSIKSIKKLKKNQVKLTWKKVKNATGYEVYQSMKKNSGYKKVKTITKNKTVTYKAGKLKKKKTYYFKIRTYRKAGGTTYYGNYSNVK
ncbi:MAG: DUF4430 domain-containing protein, partial [Anaerobutyricum hallii]|nr:DUF4430 domain-containing protein [Anaerobutyricum hallii]